MASDNASILEFVRTLDLPQAPPSTEATVSEAPAVTFGTGQEAVVVGDHVAEFSSSVEPGVRSQVSNCLLLAQLAADHATAGMADIMAWYRVYVQVLSKTGWAIAGMDLKTAKVTDEGLDVHQAIIPVLTAMLGPVAAAASMVVTVLEGLQAVNKGIPWITLFNRSSMHASGAKLQFGFVDAPSGEDIAIKLLAVSLQAEKVVTQVLFFRLSRHDARLRTSQSDLTISHERLRIIAPGVAQRVYPFLLDNIARISVG